MARPLHPLGKADLLLWRRSSSLIQIAGSPPPTHLSQSCGRNGPPASTDLKSSSLLKKRIAVKSTPCPLLSFPGSRCHGRGVTYGRSMAAGIPRQAPVLPHDPGQDPNFSNPASHCPRAQTHDVKIRPQTPPLHSVSGPKGRDPSVLGGEGLEVSVEGGPQQSLRQEAALRGWDSVMGPQCTRHVES